MKELKRDEEKMKPSVEKSPKCKLKTLPPHLKYAFLGEKEKLSVIIAVALEDLQEKRLLEVLKLHKEEIGWSLADLKGISPTVYMHKILLEEGAKPV